jgi:hypothetical protein
MTRGQQTTWIVGAIVATGGAMTFALWPEPNLDGLSPSKKCEYASYYRSHGGSVEACKKRAYTAARDYLLSR